MKFICAYQMKFTGMFTYAAQSFDHEAVIFKWHIWEEEHS